MIRRYLIFSLLCAIALFSSAYPVGAAERILEMNVEARVTPDALLVVTEEIVVMAEGKSIRRGIRRTLPRDNRPRRQAAQFRLLEATLDGREVPAAVELEPERIGIRLGDPGRMLASGRHAYRLTYSLTRQLSFFRDHDELYWNVTGNEWAFPIERATFRVILPEGAEIEKYDAYTGPSGAKGKDYSFADGLFRTSRPLARREGFTVAVGFAKGLAVMKPPSLFRRLSDFLLDYGLALVPFSLCFAWYCRTWRPRGKRAKAQVVVPRFAPPPGFYPGLVRRLVRGIYDDAALAADILYLAVGGFLQIRCDRSSDPPSLTLIRNRGGDDRALRDLAPGLQELLARMYAAGGERLQIAAQDKASVKIVHGLRPAMEAAVRAPMGLYKVEKGRQWFVGFALYALGSLLLLFSPPGGGHPVKIALAGVALLASSCLAQSFRGAWRAVPIGAWAVAAWFVFHSEANPVAAAVKIGVLSAIPCLFLLYPAFSYLTEAGEQAAAEIEGFAMYLKTAEAHRLETLYPAVKNQIPDRTPQLFERFLPYALALDAARTWADGFAALLRECGYRPEWYEDADARAGNSALDALTAGLLGDCLLENLKTSENAWHKLYPSSSSSASDSGFSSSGLDGGGSSGGGGGGGGGEGW